MSALAPTIVPLRTAERSLSRIGGKARSLAQLVCADFPVPTGFIITAEACTRFIASNAIALPPAADASIADAFDSGNLDASVEREILIAYAALGGGAVAVRSSASTEDLPDLSFAGQHASFLNVRGEEELLHAVRGCWASLWSARAVAYRSGHRVESESAVMAVVVQTMVDASVSGVVFTANPATGRRSELTVSASFGLGEAIVGGAVDADTFAIDRDSLRIIRTSIGDKAHMTAPGDGGVEVHPVSEARRRAPSITPEHLREIGAMSLRVETLFDGVPQDIEWAFAGKRLWLLQARPITGLPADIEMSWAAPAGMQRLLRRQVVENMPAPLSPLFEDLYLRQGLDRGMDDFVSTMGLPIDLDEFIERPMFVSVNGYGYARYDLRSAARIVRLMPRLLWWSVRSLPRFMRNIVPLWRDEGRPRYLESIAQWRSLDVDNATDEQLVDGIRALALADAGYWFYITLIVGAAKMTEGWFSVLLSTPLVPGKLTSGMFLRGFESKTLQAQLRLASIGDAIHAMRLSMSADELGEWIQRAPAASSIRTELARYRDEFGHQIYNLDFVDPVQGEDERSLLLGLVALARMEGAQRSLIERRSRLVADREALTERTQASVGPIRGWLFRRLLRAAQEYGPFREEALFYMGAAWPTLRRLALTLGGRLASAGTFDAPDDIFYLDSAELSTACADLRAGGADLQLRGEIQRRRELRQLRMRVHPPGRVPPDLRVKFWIFDLTGLLERMETQKHNAADAHMLSGFAVSPGRITGIACVIRSPDDFAAMADGAILVCPTTTPAWTPLFAQAVGLVTDVGGILAHGSIIAREYGIPAVLGTGTATKRIISGQRIRVDGDAGTVTVLDE